MNTAATNQDGVTLFRQFDMGNNESLVEGVFPQADGTFLALTRTCSRTYKTRKGAERWLLKFTRRAA